MAKKRKLVINFSPHPQQEIVLNHPARFKVLACGRRWGKTTLCLFEILKTAWENPNAVCWWIAPTYRQSEIGYRALERVLKDSDIVERHSRKEMTIELVNGSLIEFKSAERPDNLHGEGLSLVVVDEAARIDGEKVWYEALRPTLADTGGKAMLISTPKGKNWFFREWLKGYRHDDPEYASWQFPTWGNPFINPKEIESLKRNMPELTFREQIMAEFIETGGVVFRNVRECIDNTIVLPEPPDPLKVYVMGVDLARKEDFTVIVVLDMNGRLVYFDRFNELDWKVQKERIVKASRLYNNAPVLIDATGVGDPIVQELLNAGVNVRGYKFTTVSKDALIQNLALRLENLEIRFPDIPQLIKELEGFDFEVLPSGRITYKSALGTDDCVMALALAAWQLSASGGFDLIVSRYLAPRIDLE
ncbi:MAG: phage terminase large subunit [Thermosphaera sp.]